MVVAPIKPKFHPTPIIIKPAKKFPNDMPDKLTKPAENSSIKPIEMILFTPKRFIKCPVKKDGKNIAKTCAPTISAALFWVNPHPTTANGVDVITRVIRA